VQKLKKIFAVVCLFAFLFPFVETGVHGYVHGTDFHCTATTQHLHKAEHHCTLCDFTAGFSGSPSFNDYHFQLNKLTVLYFLFSEDHYLLQKRHFLSLRGPPALV